jgi:hypothetical protein
MMSKEANRQHLLAAALVGIKAEHIASRITEAALQHLSHWDAISVNSCKCSPAMSMSCAGGEAAGTLTFSTHCLPCGISGY